MIAVDTSALVAIALKEPQAQACMDAMIQADVLLISAGTLAEFLIVAARRNLEREAKNLISDLNFKIIPVTEASAYRAAVAYQKWGKGVHPAQLNYGDCFAYEVATAQKCPLLYVGQDFAKTDMHSALESIA